MKIKVLLAIGLFVIVGVITSTIFFLRSKPNESTTEYYEDVNLEAQNSPNDKNINKAILKNETDDSFKEYIENSLKDYQHLEELKAKKKEKIEDEKNTTLELKQFTVNREKILSTAESAIGQIPYQWGGKPSMSGFDSTWGTFDENEEIKGLDCSGFVTWVYMTSGFNADYCYKLYNTSTILLNFDNCERDELEIGDLGIKHDGSQGINHVGIYAGNNEWIHCSSEGGSVVRGQDNGELFTIYKKMPMTMTEEVETCLAKVYAEEDKQYLIENVKKSIAKIPKRIQRKFIDKTFFIGNEEKENRINLTDNVVNSEEEIYKKIALTIYNEEDFKDLYDKNKDNYNKFFPTNTEEELFVNAFYQYINNSKGLLLASDEIFNYFNTIGLQNRTNVLNLY